MASTTKIMTAIIAIQTTDPNAVVTIHQDAIDEVRNNAGSSADLVAGDKLTLKDLLYGLMLPSGDDAAVAIADTVSGSTDKFVNVMNILAYRLHLYQTHYINPDGLTYYNAPNTPIPGHYTTAYDLIRLAQYAMKLPLFAQIVKTGYYNLPATTSHHAYKWVNTNDLLGTHPTEFPTLPGTTGIKTGYTAEAGYCLVFSATHNGHNLIGVVLFDTNTNTVQRFLDAKKLLNWGFGLPVRPPTS
jgi:D-alanyl-D-alanine carboxypeptidase (penicillin-binding protein 5/6)